MVYPLHVYANIDMRVSAITIVHVRISLVHSSYKHVGILTASTLVWHQHLYYMGGLKYFNTKYHTVT